MADNARPKVVIVGAGFGGLFAARELGGKPVDVLLIDRHNYHTFTPLLYQVATAALDPSEIAYPVRSIFRKKDNVQVLLGEVTAIDTARQCVTVKTNGQERAERYDYLILAAGSTPTYFGNNDFRQHAFELRTLSDAIELRNHVLRLFEKAAWTEDAAQRDAMTTIVVVGGGPTGLETAGAIFELYNHVLDREYRRSRIRARVVLVEMQPYLLAPYPDKLRAAARKQLESLGVEVLLSHKLLEVTHDHVRLEDGTTIPTHTLVWSAGVKGSPLAQMLNVSLMKNGRVPIERTTEVKGLERVYAVGDMVYLEDPKNGEPYPMMIPVAQQQGVLAGKNILRRIKGEPQAEFKYLDRGLMATIGRTRAVAWLYNRIPLTGMIAWLAWLAFHLITLMGFRNRLNVLVNWVWNYFTYDRSVRIILDKPSREDEL